MVFADSDVYKLMEAAAWEVGRSARPTRIGASRPHRSHRPGPGGTMATSTRSSGVPASPTDTATWSGVTSCTTTGTCCRPPSPEHGRPGRRVRGSGEARRRPRVRHFGDGGIERVGGHPEIELGLVELARGYRRGALPPPGGPVRRARGHRDARRHPLRAGVLPGRRPGPRGHGVPGHAVRALYLAAGAVDVAVETGDEELLESIIAPMGARPSPGAPTSPAGWGPIHTGEAFGDDFVLPPTGPTPRPAPGSPR